MPKISSLPTASTPTSSDVLAGVQNGVTKKFSLAIIADFLQSLFVPKTNVGVADGVASLDSNGKVPGNQLDLSGKQDTITANGILKGDGAGGVTAATAGTDYQEPLTAGTDYATPAQLDGKANQAQLATAESGSTASRAYAVGEYFCWNGLLYRAKTAISSGGTFTPGTNCEAVTVGAELNGLSNRLMAFELAHGKSLQIQPRSNISQLQCLAASSGARTTTAILYFLSLYSTNSIYHIISPIVTGSNMSVSTSGGVTTITNNHPSDTVTIMLQILNTAGHINYTVV